MAANNIWSADMKSTEKKTILQHLAQLEMKVHELERERATRVFGKRNEFRTDGAALEEYDTELNEHRKIEKKEIMKHLSKLRHQVVKFKKLLKDIKSTTKYVETLKVEMELVESGLIDFKDKYKKLYDILVKDENSLSQEIGAYERRFDLWDNNNEEITVDPPKPISQNRIGWQAPTTLPAVNVFEEYVQRHGHSQGWDNCDHDVFLKALNKYQGQHQKFLKAALSDLPGYNAEEVENHYRWYMEYCSLLDNKRKAIHQWRLQQEAVKEERLEHAKQTKQQEQQLKTKKESTYQKKIAAEREKNKQKLIEWKELKQQKEELSKQALMQQTADLVKQKEKEDSRRLAIQQQISQYASQKAQEMEKQQKLEEERRREEIHNRKLANEEAKKLAYRDLQAVEVKLNLQKQKLMEENNRKIRLEKARKQPPVKRDPSRLYQLTSGWEQRLKQPKNREESYSLSAMPKRAVPAWRQGI